MEDGIRSVLNLDKIFFEDINYHNAFSFDKSDLKQEYDLNFTRRVAISEDNTHCRVSLSVNVLSKDKTISASATIVGLFSCDCPDQKLRETVMNDNTVAILFPYLRSQISLITTQPDMNPIVLPPVNVVELFKQGKTIE